MKRNKKLHFTRHLFDGAYEQIVDAGLEEKFQEWEEIYLNDDYKLNSQLFLMEIEMKKKKRKIVREKFVLPTARRKPSEQIWSYAFLLLGEKKIGKTTFAVEGAEEFVLQFDKPQLALEVREEVIEDWKQLKNVLQAIEDAADSGTLPYNRIIVDGVGECYQQCQEWACKKHLVDHPSDSDWGLTWNLIKEEFTAVVNRFLRLQTKANCGLVFIAHSEWKERRIRGGETIEKLVPNLPSKCEEIVNGKVDGWFQYDYVGNDRVLIIQGNEEVGAGHRIDGHFLTPEGERVIEVPMGDSATEALENFLKAFNNEQTFTVVKEKSVVKKVGKKIGKRAKKKGTKKKINKKRI